ncbi:MAG: hypothetical protein SEPTF4163_002461 [Sporothrix epigloea]
MSAVAHHDTYNGDEETPLIIEVHTQDVPHIRQQQKQIQRRRAAALAMAGMFMWRVGALYGATAVALGAFGAHGLKNRISDPAKLANWSTAAHYQLAHSVAMLAARGHPVASTFFAAGMTMFSGSIYALVLDPERFKVLGPVTPIGGLCLILGWLALVFSRGRIQL